MKSNSVLSSTTSGAAAVVVVGVGSEVAGTVDVVDVGGSDTAGVVVVAIVVTVTDGDEVTGPTLPATASGASGAHDTAARHAVAKASTTP